MKKSLFVVLALLALGRAFAQTTTIPTGPSIIQQLDSMFRPLDKADITSGLLFSKAIPLVEPMEYTSTPPQKPSFTPKPYLRRRQS